VPTAVSPPARYDAVMAWNGPRQRLQLVGGISTLTENDLWELTSTGWTDQYATASAPGRAGEALVPLRDGSGILEFGGFTEAGYSDELWELRWDSNQHYERCATGSDNDGDGLAGCADPDCWSACAPLCPPGALCDPMSPRCGDNACNADLETCGNCPGDCGVCP
jgi:hypothetical protein